MAEIIQFENRKRRRFRKSLVVQKVISGQMEEYFDFNFLSPDQPSVNQKPEILPQS
jgi:hypothetical protein